ncbi:hypothetical protein OG696_35970 [Streptomyces sp. NBC_00656]|uniref:hypothetical protein n=1 Tax=Streptomyces sp. NBC_00656 TaxID=2903668 RepID=UPI00324C24BA
MSHAKGRSGFGGLSAATVGTALVLTAVSGFVGALTADCSVTQQVLLGSGLCVVLGLVTLLLARPSARRGPPARRGRISADTGPAVVCGQGAHQWSGSPSGA